MKLEMKIIKIFLKKMIILIKINIYIYNIINENK
jgi:hypothetical protein